jgi:hypothetical protein
LLEEKPIIDCVEQIDEFYVPHMPEFENIVADDIVVDMSGFSTPVSEPKPEPTSFDKPTHKCVPYRHPRHTHRRNGNHAFKTLQKRRERQ